MTGEKTRIELRITHDEIEMLGVTAKEQERLLHRKLIDAGIPMKDDSFKNVTHGTLKIHDDVRGQALVVIWHS